MTRLILRASLLTSLLTGCATAAPHSSPAVPAPTVEEATADPAPTPHWARTEGRPASRSRQDRRSPAATGTSLSSTAYCETGLMANGHRTYRGAVAGNAWPLGTRLHVSNSPYGPGVFTVTDRIGHGSQLDFAIPGDCGAARQWGRRTVKVAITR